MRVAVDIGGTFTDVVVFDEANGSLALAKALSTPAELARGVLEGLTKASVRFGEVSSLIHGSTVVINAIIERQGAKTALVTTKGFRDVYEIGRINRPESFNPRFRKHRPLVPRENIFEVTERMLADGSVRTPFDEAEAREVARIIKEEGFEAVAVLFLHSYRAPEHEIRMCEILRETEPKLFLSASHELSREYREYERTSTVAANAYVGPKVSQYLGDLERRLRDHSFAGNLMIMQSNGGLSDVEMARRQCIQMMESGPAGGVVGTMALCEVLDLDAAIAFDMGGTTAKASVIRRGEPSLSPDYFIGGYNEGLAIRIPVLDIVEVGTGGGSIAWLDEGGGLHVGPRSAGAEPGPASYGRGGTEPTVTDANVILGRLSPEQFSRRRNASRSKAPRTRLYAKSWRSRSAVNLERAAAGMLQVATSPRWPTRCGMSLSSAASIRAISLWSPMAAADRCMPRRWPRNCRFRRLSFPTRPAIFPPLACSWPICGATTCRRFSSAWTIWKCFSWRINSKSSKTKAGGIAGIRHSAGPNRFRARRGHALRRPGARGGGAHAGQCRR